MDNEEGVWRMAGENGARKRARQNGGNMAEMTERRNQRDADRKREREKERERERERAKFPSPPTARTGNKRNADKNRKERKE